jgi:hypothetical protein
LGCAWAVDQIVKVTTGIDFNTLSTAEMYNELRNGMGIPVDANNPPPGSIIISPTTDGGAIGHVGIVGYDGLVYSNSSGTGLWSQNYTVSSWNRYFGANRHLRVRSSIARRRLNQRAEDCVRVSSRGSEALSHE